MELRREIKKEKGKLKSASRSNTSKTKTATGKITEKKIPLAKTRLQAAKRKTLSMPSEVKNNEQKSVAARSSRVKDLNKKMMQTTH